MVLQILQSSDFMEWISYPPGSMYFILLLSIVVAFLTTLLTKLLTDTDEMERKQKLIKAHQEEKKEIIKLAESEPNRYRKRRKSWEKKDIFLKKTQQGMAMQRLKPTLFTFLPMIIIFAILRGIYGTNPVAAPPMNPWPEIAMLPDMIMAYTKNKYAWTAQVYGTKRTIARADGWINFTAWYFLCSLGVNTLLQRILKLQTQASGGMEQMFKGSQDQASSFPDI